MFIRRPKKKILHTFSIEKCNNCNYTEIRDFKKGDYVYKETDRCECGGLRYVDLIYAIETEVGERAETIPS